MNADMQIGRLLLYSGTLRVATWWRWVPFWIGPVYAQRWWQVRGVIVGVFRWSYYAGLARL